MELSPQLRTLRDFYYKTAKKLPEGQDYVHAQGLIDKPSFFTLEHLKTHLNNPLLMPTWFKLFWQGKAVDCTPAVGYKVIQGAEVPFLNKGILEQYLANGASMVLEGIDLLEPMINAMCGAIDQASECVLSNSVVFFSQKAGGEAYRGHLDTSDVLVVQLAGAKRWKVHQRQQPRWVELNELEPAKMGPVQADFVMRPGDALFVKSFSPHIVETAADYSLHMAFDICDRAVNADTALHLLLEHYNRDAAACYAPTPEIIDRLARQAGSPEYRKRVAALSQAQKANYAQARSQVASNRVGALDRLIALDKAPKG
jgi:Cupin superfamily protein